MLTDPAWSVVPGLVHGFFDRHDCREPVDWPGVLARHGVGLPLARPRQVHGATVLLVDEVTASSEGDAVVATRSGVAVGIITADCAPVLLRDRCGRAVAAVHAGWRGAAAGVVQRALAMLSRVAGVEAAQVEVVVGPAVGACCYEVGDEVRRAFAARGGTELGFAFTPRRDRFMFDLRAAVGALAQAAGAGAVRHLGPCTMCDASYASYRRDGAAAGRQLSFIALR
jgi:hypothetical protein